MGTKKSASFKMRLKVVKKPLTFQDKILYKMARDRNPILTLFADKVAVRKYVRERIGSEYLTVSYGEFKSISELTRQSFPRNFVLKSNHGSGASVICWEGAPRGGGIPSKASAAIWDKHLIHPDDLVWEHLINLSSRWMKTNYYWAMGKFPEWAYKEIEPQILSEEVLTHNSQIPEDYKFFMVNGECIFIQVDVSRYDEHKRDLYSPNWDLLNASFLYPKSGSKTDRPSELTEMINIAKILAAGLDFIRVDLYRTDSGIKFGELTNYPEGGTADIQPKELSINFAKNWVQNY